MGEHDFQSGFLWLPGEVYCVSRLDWFRAGYRRERLKESLRWLVVDIENGYPSNKIISSLVIYH